jgi:hypothetical protein
VLSHMNVKLRVFTHGIEVFVLSHIRSSFVYLHMKIRVFTHKVSCIHTATDEKLCIIPMGYKVVWSLNTDSNLI